MLLGCIADDLTGATDVAVTFSREGLSVIQVNGVPDAGLSVPDADAIVVALKSRTVAAADAVAQSLAALDWLRKRAAQHIYFKICSTFDSTPAGNIGPVADALCEATGARLNVVTPAYPRNARTVYQGHLFVGDALLSDTGMRTHPLTPMTDSNLVRVLGSQTQQRNVSQRFAEQNPKHEPAKTNAQRTADHGQRIANERHPGEEEGESAPALIKAFRPAPGRFLDLEKTRKNKVTALATHPVIGHGPQKTTGCGADDQQPDVIIEVGHSHHDQLRRQRQERGGEETDYEETQVAELQYQIDHQISFLRRRKRRGSQYKRSPAE